MFWRRKATPDPQLIAQLEQRVRELDGDLKALARDVVDLDDCVARWMKRDRERARRAAAAGEMQAPTASVAQGPLLAAGKAGARARRAEMKRAIRARMGRPNGLDHGAPSEGIEDGSLTEADPAP